jgi:hypothetical protein
MGESSMALVLKSSEFRVQSSEFRVQVAVNSFIGRESIRAALDELGL